MWKYVIILRIWIYGFFGFFFFLKAAVVALPSSQSQVRRPPSNYEGPGQKSVCHSCHNHAGVVLHSWESWTSSSPFHCLLYGCFEAVTPTRLMLFDQDLLCQINFIKLFKDSIESQLQAFQLALASSAAIKDLDWWTEALERVTPTYCWILSSVCSGMWSFSG